MARRLRQPLRPNAAFPLQTKRVWYVHRDRSGLRARSVLRCQTARKPRSMEVLPAGPDRRNTAAAIRAPMTGREGPPLCGEGPRPRLGPLGLSLLKQVSRCIGRRHD